MVAEVMPVGVARGLYRNSILLYWESKTALKNCLLIYLKLHVRGPPGVAQLIESYPVHHKVAGSIPSQDTYEGN